MGAAVGVEVGPGAEGGVVDGVGVEAGAGADVAKGAGSVVAVGPLELDEQATARSARPIR